MTDKKRVISFSLWGNEARYTVGALANALYAEEIYPGWICRFYISHDVDAEVVGTLKQMDNVEVVLLDKPNDGDYKNSLLRFLPAGDEDVEVMISRDCDSRLGYREKYAVDEWLQSDKKFHIMYDHPNYSSFFLAGCWGVKSPALQGISALIRYYLLDVANRPWEKITHIKDGNVVYRKGVDQHFLENTVYPLASLSCMRHDDFSKNVLGEKIGLPFPTEKSLEQGYVGETMDVDETPVRPEWRMISFEEPVLQTIHDYQEIERGIVKDFS